MILGGSCELLGTYKSWKKASCRSLTRGIWGLFGVPLELLGAPWGLLDAPLELLGAPWELLGGSLQILGGYWVFLGTLYKTLIRVLQDSYKSLIRLL